MEDSPVGDDFIPSTDGPRSSDADNPEPLLRALIEHKPLLGANIRRARSAGLLRHRHDFEDAWQAARLGFIQACRRYDDSRGVSIGSFARGYVTGAVRAALESSAAENVSVPLDTVVEEMLDIDDAFLVDPDAAERVEATEVAAAIQALMTRLSSRQRYIVLEVFWEDRSQADVARDLGVSRKAITVALQKIYDYGREALAEYHAA